MAKTKYGNKPVYACPRCWKQLPGVTNKINKNLKIRCLKCFRWIGTFKQMAKPDSLAEHTRGYGELKPLEVAGMITDLKHHEVFKLVPAEYIKIGENGWIKSELGVSETIVKSLKLSGYLKMRPELKYESDFTYKMKEEFIVEEAKELTRIDKTTSKTTAAGQKITQTVKVDFPYFTNDDDFRHFRKICQLMLAIHGHRVQVRAGGQLWMFNEDGKLEMVHGRIK